MDKLKRNPGLIFLIVTSVWVVGVVFYLLFNGGLSDNLGRFGDFFGVVNALFAGLAFASILWTIILQHNELELQRKALDGQKRQFKSQNNALREQFKELELQRKALEEQGKQLNAQNQTLQRQRFEGSFFQLLGQHSETVNSMVILRNGEFSGQDCFGLMFRELKENLHRNYTSTEEEDLKSAYEKVFLDNNQYIGRYFRHLYNIVRFVHQSEVKSEGKAFYIDLIRAQLSSDELGLLFYHSLSKRGADFGGLFGKYDFFNEMPPEPD